MSVSRFVKYCESSVCASEPCACVDHKRLSVCGLTAFDIRNCCDDKNGLYGRIQARPPARASTALSVPDTVLQNVQT